MKRTHGAFVTLALLLTAGLAAAADPPTVVNYQGVLRDATDKPRAGAFDMVFRFYDALSAGNEILVDSHTGGGGNAVTATGGLFNVQLGGGTVTDGSGAGTYTSLSDVFRDYGAAYLEITVGAEVLSPRIRIQSAAYALNASNLQGKPASNFVDVSSTGQTKAGHLTVNGGIDASVASGVALNASGTLTGGAFVTTGASAYVADTSVVKTGIRAQGDDAGGYFLDTNNTARVYLAAPGAGIEASGTFEGGFFTDTVFPYNDFVYLARSDGYGVYASGNVYGIDASGSTAGGHFATAGAGSAFLASGSNGIHASGAPAGHFDGSLGGVGSIDLASGDFGALGHGRYPGAGAYFDDPYSSGKSWIGFGDEGIYGIGAYAGGYFTRSFHNVQAFLGSSDYSSHPVAVYGYSNESGAYPGFFRDDVTGAYAWVGSNGAKIVGNGSVGFIQNHPADPSKTIVYAAPEGDEVAVYTRGSARLVDGEARVTLGETFALVANPDIGLTATVTPNGDAIALGVAEKSTRELLVRGPAGSNAEFDYMVWGLRVGFEDRAVVQTKREEAYIPSHRVEEDVYAKAPELRSYSALSRYTRMRQASTGRADAPDLTASKALESAIHVFDPATDSHGPHKDGTEPTATVPRSIGNATPVSIPAPVAPGTAAETGGGRAMALTRSVPTDKPEVPTPSGNRSAASLPNTTLVNVVETVEAGDILANDPRRPGELRRASSAEDPGVVGIAAGESGTTWSEWAPLALAGAVLSCKVDASYGAIAPNDLLVASPTSGHAMRAGENPANGTVVGKALEPLEAGTGTIRVLVMSR